MFCFRYFAVFFCLFLGGAPASAFSQGLLRTVWNCHVPCATRDKKQLLSSLQVSYCAVSALTPAMFDLMTPLCQAKTKREDAIAVRMSSATVANCHSSSNTCPNEGLVRAGFTCRYVCPSEDLHVKKFTACARTAEEAWTYADEVCKGATPPDPAYSAAAKTCIADGETPCE